MPFYIDEESIRSAWCSNILNQMYNFTNNSMQKGAGELTKGNNIRRASLEIKAELNLIPLVTNTITTSNYFPSKLYWQECKKLGYLQFLFIDRSGERKGARNTRSPLGLISYIFITFWAKSPLGLASFPGKSWFRPCFCIICVTVCWTECTMDSVLIKLTAYCETILS